jgi:hypothetical protein
MQKYPVFIEENGPSKTTLEKHPRNSRENDYSCYDKIRFPRVLRGFARARIRVLSPSTAAELQAKIGKNDLSKRDIPRENPINQAA